MNSPHQLARVAIVTNIPTPYREDVYAILSSTSHLALKVIYCSRSEPNRHWTLAPPRYDAVFLGAKSIESKGQFVHFSARILPVLSSFAPNVVITSGYGPIMAQAFAWSRLRNRHHIPFTDGTLASEASLTPLHKVARTFVISRSAAFIGASRKSLELFRSYGAPPERIFQSCLSVDPSRYEPRAGDLKNFDLMFCGQLVDRKMPGFFCEVSRSVAAKLGRLRVLIVGDGPLRDTVSHQLRHQNIELTVTGFIQPDQIAHYYRQSRLLLFPTKWDPWGVVANEACAAGVPVVTTPEAGAAGELVVHGETGLVLPPTHSRWVEEICSLLASPAKYELMARNALCRAQNYKPIDSAQGIRDAIDCALRGDRQTSVAIKRA